MAGEIKEQNTLEEDWDYLIILDACRFDTFEKCYTDYLEGKLEKRRSLGSATDEWLLNTFTKENLDILYVTANPKINTRGVSTVKEGFDPEKIFDRVVEVWDFGWDRDLKVVPPEEMKKATLSEDIQEDKNRIILHYVQPHAPYISYESDFSSLGATGMADRDEGTIKQWFWDKAVGFLGRIERSLKKKHAWWIRRILGMTPINPTEQIWRDYKDGTLSKEDIHELYEENLRIALESIASFVDRLEGKVVISADHGEALGEEGCWGHENGSDLDVLVDVPWLEVEKKEK